MTVPHAFVIQSVRWAIRVAILLGFAAGVVVLMLWLAGKFSPKVPATADAGQTQASPIEGQVVTVQQVRLPCPNRPSAQFARCMRRPSAQNCWRGLQR